MSTRRYSSEYKALRPFIIEEIRGILGGSVAVAGAVSGIASHALNDTSIHTGQLAQTQAPWASTKNELATHAANPDAHHAKQHLLANASGLGSDHTVSGAVAGWVLRATAATAARFMQLSHADLGGVAPDQHHAQQHNITGTDHTIVGAQYQIVGATGTNTLGLLTPSATPGAAAAILRTTTAGLLTLKTLDVTDFLYVDGTLDFGTNTLYEDATYLQVAGSKPLRFGQNIGNANWTIYNAGGADFGGSVNITGNSNLYVAGTVGGAAGVLQTLNDRVGILCVPDPQFALDVAGPARAQYFIGPHAIQLRDALLIAHFDGPERGPVGEPNGHMGQVPAVSGDVVFRYGKFNKAVEIADAYTNLLGNPSFEADATGWTNYAGGTAAGTRTRADDEAWDGYYSYKIAKTGGAAADRFGAYTSRAAVAGTTYAISCWVKLADVTSASSANVAELYAWAGAGSGVSVYTNVLGEWVELFANVTATGTTLEVHLRVGDCATAVAYFDAVQATATTAKRPFWGGGSARVDGSLTYSGLAVQWQRFTAMCWFRIADTAPRRGQNLRLFEIYNNNSNRVNVLVSSADNTLRAFHLTGGTSTQLISAATVAARTWHHAAVVVEGTGARLYLNGVQVASGTVGVIVASGALAYIGRANSGEPLNGMVDDWALVNRALTANDIRAVYESNAPVFAESSVWSWRATPNGLVWADENGLWMRDASGASAFGIYGGLAGSYSWGGASLDTGDLMIGRAGAGYVLWDNSAATLEVMGAITAMSGSIAGVLSIGASGKIVAGSTEISNSGILLPRTVITQGDDVFDAPDLSPAASVTIRYRDTATSWTGADGTYTYAGNTVMRMYSSSVHYVDSGLNGEYWAHALDGVIEAPALTTPANSGNWMRRLWLLAGSKFLTVGTGGAANGVGVNIYNPQKALHVGGTVLIAGDEGGYANAVGLTNTTDTAVSTGTGTVKMNSTTARNSDAWVKIYIGTTAYWIPAWSNIN